MSQENALPLGRRFLLSELPGRLTKWLEVPPGRQGVALDAQGRARTWPRPGRYKVLGAGARLRGQGAGLVTGWVPAEAFPVRVQARGLLTADGQAVDGWWVVQAKVEDPVRFFQRQVAPAGVLHNVVLEVADSASLAALSAVTRQYLAEDLVRGVPGDHLPNALRQRLQPVVAAEGLVVQSIPLMVFWMADDRLAVMEKMQELQEKARRLEMEDRIAAAEAQADWEAFVREFEEDTGIRLQVSPEQAQAKKGEEENEQTKPPSLFSWAAWKALITGEGPQHPLLGKLFGHQERKEECEEFDRPHKRWWLPRTAFLVTALLIAIGGTFLVFQMRGSKAWVDDNAWGILATLWTFGLGVAFDSVRVLFEKQEELAEAEWRCWEEKGYTWVDDLARQKPIVVDAVVRQQSAAMLRTLANMLNGMRSRVFREGNIELALQIKNLERQAKVLSEEVQKPDFGKPPYLDKTLKISKAAWTAMLDYDERLIVDLNTLLNLAEQIQEVQMPSQESLANLERGLSRFRSRFSRRTQALRPQYSSTSGS